MPGDLVLTHRGRWRRVLDTMRRPHSGDLFEIEFESERYRKLRVTPGHPFLVGRVDRTGRLTQRWAEAHQLRAGDLLALPAIVEGSAPPEAVLTSQVLVGRGRHAAVAEAVSVDLNVETCW